jgi:hypothetical protein
MKKLALALIISVVSLTAQTGIKPRCGMPIVTNPSIATVPAGERPIKCLCGCGLGSNCETIDLCMVLDKGGMLAKANLNVEDQAICAPMPKHRKSFRLFRSHASALLHFVR